MAAARFTSAPQRAGHEQADAGEGGRAEQHRADGAGNGRRAAAPGVPAQPEPHREEDGGLDQLDRDDREDLGAEQARAAERGGAEPLEHAVAALESGGDAERDHRGRHDGQRQNPGHEEVGRGRRRGRHHRHLGEEEEEDDGDAEGEQQGLAAAQRHVDFGRGLRGQGTEGRGGRAHRACLRRRRPPPRRSRPGHRRLVRSRPRRPSPPPRSRRPPASGPWPGR